jgi:hypothetical protein
MIYSKIIRSLSLPLSSFKSFLIFLLILFTLTIKISLSLSSINKEIDIFNEKNLEYLNYLKENLINQIENKQEFYSIIDCKESNININININNSLEKQIEENLLNFCLIENKEGKLIPFLYSTIIYNNNNTKNKKNFNFTIKEIMHKEINMDDYINNEAEKLKRLNQIKDFLCHIYSECKNLEIFSDTEKNKGHFCYFYEYEYDNHYNDNDIYSFNKENKLKKFYFFSCEIFNNISKEKYLVSLSWKEGGEIDIEKNKDKDKEYKTKEYKIIYNENFYKKNFKDISVYVKTENTYERYDKKISGLFVVNEKVNLQAKNIKKFIKEKFPYLPSKDFIRKISFFLVDDENENTLFYYFTLIFVLLMVIGTFIFLVFKWCRQRRVDDKEFLSNENEDRILNE